MIKVLASLAVYIINEQLVITDKKRVNSELVNH